MPPLEGGAPMRMVHSDKRPWKGVVNFPRYNPLHCAECWKNREQLLFPITHNETPFLVLAEMEKPGVQNSSGINRCGLNMPTASCLTVSKEPNGWPMWQWLFP